MPIKKSVFKTMEVKSPAPTAFTEKTLEKKPALEKTALPRIEAAMTRPAAKTAAKPMEMKSPASAAFVEKAPGKKPALEKIEPPRTETAITQPAAIKPVERKMAEEKPPVPEETSALDQGIKKEYLEGKTICRVTFRLPKSAAPNGKSVFIVGDFNNWNIHAHQMKKQKNGDHTISLTIAAGKEYQFRYLIDESKWENDWKADKYVRSPYGDCDNSVVIV